MSDGSFTLEQTLSLQDAFTNTLLEVEIQVNSTLGTFQKFQETIEKDVSLGGSERLSSDLSSSSKEADQLVGAIESLTDSLRIAGEAGIKVGSSVKGISRDANIDDLNNQLGSFNSQLTNANNKTNILADSMELADKKITQALETGDANKLVKAQMEANKLQTAFDKTIDTTVKLNAQIDLTKNAIEKMKSSLSKKDGSETLKNNLNGSQVNAQKLANSPMSNNIGKASQEAGKLDNNLAKAVASQTNLNGLARIMSFAFAYQMIQKIGQEVSDIANKIDEITLTGARLNLMNDGSQSTDELSAKVMGSAMDSRSAWKDTADFVSKVGINAGEAFASNDEIIQFSNTLQKAYKIGGASAQEQASSMTQLVQALSMGALRGQELNSVMAGAPQVIDAITKELGVTRGELREMAGDGQITADVIKNALFNATDEINAKFQEMPLTFGDVMTQLGNIGIVAFQPFMDAVNEFINSDLGTQMYEGIAIGIMAVGEVANWAFEMITAGLQWVSEHINQVMMFLTILGAVAGAVAIGMAVAWMIANYPLLLIIGAVMAIVYVLDKMGITAGEVAQFVAGAFAFIAVVVYDVVVAIVGAFAGGVQVLINIFTGLANHFLSVAEFFYNVWNDPIGAVAMLFYNFASTSLDVLASIADGAGDAGVALANGILSGVNWAISGINSLVEALNQLPGFNLGTMGELSMVSSGGLGNAIRGLAGDAPMVNDGYKTFDKFQMGEVTAFKDFAGAMKNPITAFNSAYKAVGDFDMGGVLDKVQSLTGGANMPTGVGMGNVGSGMPAGSGGKGSKPKAPYKGKQPPKGRDTSSKLGKGKEIGDIGRIKDEVKIKDDDLSMLRRIAESGFRQYYTSLTPNATLNYTATGSGDQKSASELMKMLSEMIRKEQDTALV